MIFGMKHHLMEEASGDAPPAGGGAGDAPPTPPASDGDTGGSILSGKEPDAAPTTPPEPTTLNEGWLKGVSSEFAGDDSMKHIKDLPSLVKSYVHAQKLVGKEKVVIPDQYATDHDRREFFHKVGLPRSAEEYEVKLKEDGAYLNDEFVGEFKEKAYELGVMPDQAQRMLEWYDQKLNTIDQEDEQSYAQDLESTVTELKQQYGQAYDSKINLANMVLEKTVDPEVIEDMKESGLVNDKSFIQTMIKIGEMFATEDSFDFKPKSENALTPDEAQSKINTIQGDLNHPYHNAQHPNHDEAVADMTKLFKFLG